ncbi:MAG TPA: hypothetical protein PLO89_04110 [Spirochaetota bacterium]|nr:hypothetical protein [Spirochaetota bacterium]
MKKIVNLTILIALLAFSFINFTACQTEVTTTTTSTTVVAPLVGYWKSSQGDGFEVTNATPKIFYQYDDANKGVSFAGEIVNSSSLSSETGFLTIKITDKGTWVKTVGEFLVVRWKNLSGNISKCSTPYKAGGKSTCATQTEAEAEFTEANGYYSYYGEYTKQ